MEKNSKRAYPKIGLAVSGGIDSCYLMHSFADQPNVVVLTVDHGLRPESVSETQWVIHEAKKLGLVGHILTHTNSKPQTAVQNTARNWRYDLLSKAAKNYDLDYIYLGHHSNDQAETVLSRLTHHSGYAGLCGMAQSFFYDDILFKRPLLNLSRSEISESMRGRDYLHDPSNDNTQFERVRNRQILQENPELTPRLLDISRKAQAYYIPLLKARNVFLQEYASFSPFGYCQIQRPIFDQQSEPLQQEILKFAIKYVTGNHYIKAMPSPLIGKNFTISNAEICFNKRFITIYRENRNVPKFDSKRFKPSNIPKDLTDIPFKARQTLPKETIGFRYAPQSLRYFVSIFDRMMALGF